MTETTTRAACRHCGADVREGSVFCYNCGKSIAEGAGNGKISESDAERLEKAANAADHDAPIAAPGKKLRSAADIGKRKRAYNRQPVEITWTPRTDAGNSFVIAGVLLVVLTVILVIAALYYR